MSDFTYCIHSAKELSLLYENNLNKIATMRTKQLLLSLLFLSGIINAQVNYYFEQFTNSYENLEDPISLTGGMIWDDPEFTIPVDIDFNFFNNQYTYETGLGADLYLISPLDTPYNLNEGYHNLGIMPMSADLADRAYNDDLDNEYEPGGLSPVSYKVIGEEGSHILKIEWNNVGFLENESNSYYMNFQLWLYEGSDMVEVHYGPSNVPDEFFSWEESITGMGHFEYDFDGSYVNVETKGFIIVESNVPGDYELININRSQSYEIQWDWDVYEAIYDFQNPNYALTSVPENGTVFRFYPEYAIIGMDEIESVIKMHPNPATDVLYLENDEQVLTKYQIVSLDGRILKTGTSSEQKIQLDISDLNTGLYFVRGTKNGAQFTKTISKI